MLYRNTLYKPEPPEMLMFYRLMLDIQNQGTSKSHEHRRKKNYKKKKQGKGWVTRDQVKAVNENVRQVISASSEMQDGAGDGWKRNERWEAAPIPEWHSEASSAQQGSHYMSFCQPAQTWKPYKRPLASTSRKLI